MVPLASLWLPILGSAVLVFIASALIWMVLPHHRSDWQAIPGEAALLDFLRREKVGRGQYVFPWKDPKDRSPEAMKKCKEGPAGHITLWPAGGPGMGQQLGVWFVFLVLVSTGIAWIAGHVLPSGLPYRTVARVVGSIAVLAYCAAIVPNAIWWGRSWSSTFKDIVDGILYALLTGGMFGWLWPR
jgi:hypothetical protein